MTKMNYRGSEYNTETPKAEPTAQQKEVEENETLKYRGYEQDLQKAAKNASGAREVPGGHIYRGYNDDNKNE